MNGPFTDLFKVIDRVTEDITKGEKSSFGKLIDAQQTQIKIISNSYELELDELTSKNDKLTEKIGLLNAEIENLQEKIKELSKKLVGGTKNDTKKPKQTSKK